MELCPSNLCLIIPIMTWQPFMGEILTTDSDLLLLLIVHLLISRLVDKEFLGTREKYGAK